MRPRYFKSNKKIHKKYQKTGKMGPEEVVLEILIPGEPVNWIIPLGNTE